MGVERRGEQSSEICFLALISLSSLSCAQLCSSMFGMLAELLMNQKLGALLLLLLKGKIHHLSWGCSVSVDGEPSFMMTNNKLQVVVDGWVTKPLFYHL